MSTTIVQIAMDPERGDGGVLCQLSDGRVFITVADEIRKFAEPQDVDALAAFNKAWVREPELFSGPITPRLGVPRVAPASEGSIDLEHGFIGELTPKDRARLSAIIRKNHRKYFADHPTQAQVDNLIEGIGLRTAEKLVRAAVDGGAIH